LDYSFRVLQTKHTIKSPAEKAIKEKAEIGKAESRNSKKRESGKAVPDGRFQTLPPNAAGFRRSAGL
jgi:hypothetical protein